MINLQPKDPRAIIGANSSTNRHNKYLTNQGNNYQIAGINKSGFESISNYQGLSSPIKDQD